MSLLTVGNDVCDIIGIERQVTISAGTGGDARQLYRLCKLELSELARRTSWNALTKEKTFVAVGDGVAQNNATPLDFLFMVNETLYNRTQDHEVFGPISPREYATIVSNPTSFYGDELFRIRGKVLLIWPIPTAGDTYAYEYISSELATAIDGETGKTTWLIDSDIAKLDEELIKLGVVWRWKALKGLDYAEDFRAYEMQVANSIARDGGKRTISMDPGRPPGVPMIGIPAGNWTP